MSQESNVPQEPSSGEGTPEPESFDEFDGEGTPEPSSGDVEPELEAEPPSDEGEGDEPDAGAAGGEDDEDDAWRNFEEKFNHIKNPRDRRAAMGRWVWEKTRYASQVRKEAEAARAELARRGARTPEEDEPQQAPTPNPHIEKLDQRIKGLVEKDQAVQQTQQKQLIALADTDKAIAKLEARIEIAGEQGDDYTKQLLEAKLESANLKRGTIIERYQDLSERREQFSYDVEKLMQDRDWAANVYTNQARAREAESQQREQFNAEFPRFVDERITSEADSLGAPKDDKIRRSLWKHVNQAMMVDLYRLGEQGVTEVDVPAMVKTYVKEYLEDRDLVSRQKFTQRSEQKRAVTGRSPSSPPPRGPKSPVPAALLGTGDQTPAMLRARKYLASRNL